MTGNAFPAVLLTSFLILAAALPPSADATSCGGNSSLLGSVEYLREEASRVARVRVVTVETQSGSRNDFEIVQFLDEKSLGRVGDRFVATGLISYGLNVAPGAPNFSPSPDFFAVGSEWVLILHIREQGKKHFPFLYSAQVCSSVLRLDAGRVQGFIEGPSSRIGQAPVDQEMALDALVRRIAAVLSN